MRKLAFALVLSAGMSAGVWAADVVRLDDPAALAHLRATNPAHYAQAVKILAEANHLCRPKEGALQRAHPGAQDSSCPDLLLRTSNPPKREVRFRLGQVEYAARVALSDDPARLMAANGRK